MMTDGETSLELWQTEWCPWSHLVRQRLTELGLSCLMHPVPPDRADRGELVAITGQDSIPVLRLGDRIISGSEAILEALEAEFEEPASAAAHRAKARKAAERLSAAA